MKEMMEMMKDTDLEKEYPVIAYLKKQLENKTEEEKEKGSKNIEKILTGCGFEKILVLMGRLFKYFTSVPTYMYWMSFHYVELLVVM